jgi:hypothetical protein
MMMKTVSMTMMGRQMSWLHWRSRGMKLLST